MIFAALAGAVLPKVIGAISGSGGSSQSGEIAKDETTNSKKNTTQNKQGSTSQSGSTNSSSSGTSSQVSQNESTLKNKTFDNKLLEGSNKTQTSLLDETTKNLLSGNFAKASDNSAIGLDSMKQLTELANLNVNNFDADGFVQSALDRGKMDFQDNVIPSLNQFANNTGGTAETNSMSAILNMQAKDRFAVNQNEINSKASLTANQMNMDLLQQALTASGALSDSSLPFADILKGATQTSEGVQTQSQVGEGGSEQTGTGSTTQNAATQQQSRQETQQLVEELMKIVMDENTNSTTKTNQDSSQKEGSKMGLFDTVLKGVDVLKAVRGANQIGSAE